MLTIKNYARPQSLQQAYELNQKRGSWVIGGMLWLNLSTMDVTTAIDLSDLGLDTIEETEEAFSIGAMVTLRQLELHPALGAYTQGAAAKALSDIVGVQFRNMATVGGSVFGRFGFSDVLTMLLATDCEVELFQRGRVRLEDFAREEKDRDILTRVIIHKRPGAFAYESVRNSRTDFPTLTCALSRLGGEYRVVIGARPMRPVVLRDQEGLLARGVTEERARSFSDYVAQHVTTGSNMRGSAEYRRHLARVLTYRALMELEEG
jgi:CO/xanthine dehydrogenase FAD-binding subunit